MDGETGRPITPSPFHLGSGVRNPEQAISMNASAFHMTNSASILQTEVGGVLGESRGGSPRNAARRSMAVRTSRSAESSGVRYAAYERWV
jgi:hypothetical protein